MTALVIIFSVLFLIAVIVNISVVVDISYIGGKLEYKVKYLFFKIFPLKKKSSRRKKKTAEKSNKPDSSAEKDEKLAENIAMIKDIIECSADDIKKSASKISVKDIYISFVSRNEDAAVCAVNYGILSGAVYTVVGIVSSLFRTTIKSVSVGLEFNKSGGNIYDFSFSLKMKFGTGLKTVLNIIIKYVLRRMKNERKQTQRNNEEFN